METTLAPHWRQIWLHIHYIYIHMLMPYASILSRFLNQIGSCHLILFQHIMKSQFLIKLTKTYLKPSLISYSISNLIPKHVIFIKAYLNKFEHIQKHPQASLSSKITLARDSTKQHFVCVNQNRFWVSQILTLAAFFMAFRRILYQSLAKYCCINTLHDTLTTTQYFLTLDTYLALKLLKI
jgi:hypothetical protein